MKILSALIMVLILPSLSVVASELQSIESIRQAAYTYADTQDTTRGTKRLIEVGAIDSRLRLPACTQPLNVFPSNTAPFQNNTTVGVRCQSNQPWTLYVPINVRVFERVATLNRPLPRGAIIKPDDITISEQDIQGLKYGYITDAKELQGKLLKRSLPAGSPLSSEVLTQPQVVRRGQQVSLMAKNEGLSISVTGNALSSGAIGEIVRVRNPVSKRIIEGVVVAEGVVEVTF